MKNWICRLTSNLSLLMDVCTSRTFIFVTMREVSVLLFCCVWHGVFVSSCPIIRQSGWTIVQDSIIHAHNIIFFANPFWREDLVHHKTILKKNIWKKINQSPLSYLIQKKLLWQAIPHFLTAVCSVKKPICNLANSQLLCSSQPDVCIQPIVVWWRLKLFSVKEPLNHDRTGFLHFNKNYMSGESPLVTVSSIELIDWGRISGIWTRYENNPIAIVVGKVHFCKAWACCDFTLFYVVT